MAGAFASDPIIQLEENLQCSVCLEVLTDPRTLPCCHSFCKDCLERIVKKCRRKTPLGKLIRNFPCPNCRAMFTLNPDKHVADMPRNHFICNMVKVAAVLDRGTRVPCSHNCGQSYSVACCVTCEKFLCRECLTGHNNYRGNNGHFVLTMEELSKPENRKKINDKMYCNEHSGMKLKVYCETCDKLICRDCMDFKHVKQGHSCVLVKDEANKYKEILASNNKTMEDALTEGNAFLQRLTLTTEQLDRDAKNAKNTIAERKQFVTKKVLEMLDRKAESLCKDVDEIHKSKRVSLNRQAERTKLYVENIKTSVELSKKLVDQGSEKEIISSQKMMLDNANNLLTNREKYFKASVTKLRYSSSTGKEPINEEILRGLVNSLGEVHEEKVDTENAIRKCRAASVGRRRKATNKVKTSRSTEAKHQPSSSSKETPKLSVSISNTSKEGSATPVTAPGRPAASGVLEDATSVECIKAEILKYERGLWATRLEHLYKEKFKKVLPATFIQELKFRLDIVKVQEPIPGRYILYPPHQQQLSSSKTNQQDQTQANIKPDIVLPPCSLPEIGQTVLVYISYIDNPSCFYVIRADSTLETLSEEIHKRYESTQYNSDAIQSVSPGQIFCAKFTEDGNFYRARVLQVVDSKHIKVQYVDFGNKEVIPVDSLCVLISEFQTQPIQAFECCLDGIEPVKQAREWSEDAIDKFNDLTSEKELEITVHEVDDKVLSVSLVEVSSQLDIAKEMKKAGFAVASKNLQSNPSLSSSSLSSSSRQTFKNSRKHVTTANQEILSS